MNLAQRRNEECSSLRALRKALDVVALQQVNVHIHATQITDLRVSAGIEPSGLADRGVIAEVLSPFRVHATVNRGPAVMVEVRSEEDTSEIQSPILSSSTVLHSTKKTAHRMA